MRGGDNPLDSGEYGETRILEFASTVYELARRAVPAYSSKFSKKTYTQHQHIAIICLKVREGKTYEEIVEQLVEMPRIREALNLDEVPHPSTICKAFKRLNSTIWRVILLLSTESYDLSGITGMDSSGQDRAHASRYYTRRAKLKIKQLKCTLLVDVRENPVLDVHITTTRKHDTQIGPQILERSADLIEVLLADKGYDDMDYRKRCRELGIRPVIKHREFTSLQKAWNARMDDELYNQRNQNESVNSVIKRKYGDYIRSKIWYKQFREVIVKCIVYNIDRVIQLW